MYTPEIEGKEKGGSNANITVLTFQPYGTGEGSLENEYFDTAAITLHRTFDNVFFSYDFDDNLVNFDSLNLIGNNQIILWNGHGGYSDILGYYTITGMNYKIDDLLKNITIEDLLGAAVIRTGDKRVGITSNYVKNYFQDMSNSLLYMGTCHSYEKTFISECMNKGLQSYIGFDDSVYAWYDRAMVASLSKILCEINPETDDYYTLSEAIHIAKEENGVDDGHGTQIQFLGEYQVDSLKKNPIEIIDGRYVSIYYSDDTPVRGILRIEPEGYEAYDCPAFKYAKIENNNLIIEGGLKNYDGGIYEYAIFEIPLSKDIIIGYASDDIVIPSSYDKETTIENFNRGWYEGELEWLLGYGGLQFEVLNGQVTKLAQFGS